MTDEYSKMSAFMFNPYIQMALGILAGNTGRSKSEAFANAMGGGLTSAQTAQKTALEELQQRREQALYKMKQDEYERMKKAREQLRQYAQGMSSAGGPFTDVYAPYAASDDPEMASKMVRDLIGATQAMNYGRQVDLLGQRGSGGGDGNSLTGMPDTYKKWLLMGGMEGTGLSYEQFEDKYRPNKPSLTVQELEENAKAAVEEVGVDLDKPDLAAVKDAGRKAQKEGQEVWDAMVREARRRAQNYGPMFSLPIIGDIGISKKKATPKQESAPKDTSITDADIDATAKKYNMTREEVINRLKAQGRM